MGDKALGDAEIEFGDGNTNVLTTLRSLVELIDLEVRDENHILDKIKWNKKCPLPVDFSGEILPVEEVLSDFAKNANEKKEEKERVWTDAEIKQLQEVWRIEALEGCVGDRVDAFILREIYMKSGLGIGYESARSADENKGCYFVQLPNAIEFGAMVEKDDKYYLIFSCFHASVEIGDLADKATEGDWCWERIECQWFREAVSELLDGDKCFLDHEIRKKVDRDYLFMDRYTAMIVGSHATIPVRRERATMTCDAKSMRIENIIVQMSYEKREKLLIYDCFKKVMEDYGAFQEKYRTEISEIREEHQSACEEASGPVENMVENLTRTVEKMAE